MGHRWHGVLNNPSDVEFKRLLEVGSTHESFRIKYFYYRMHDHQKTLHYHIYVEFQLKRGLEYMKFLIPRAHWEVCYKDREANLLYIDGDRHDKEDINGVKTEVYKRPIKLRRYKDCGLLPEDIEPMKPFCFEEAKIKGWNVPDLDLLSIEDEYDPSYIHIKC